MVGRPVSLASFFRFRTRPFLHYIRNSYITVFTNQIMVRFRASGTTGPNSGSRAGIWFRLDGTFERNNRNQIPAREPEFGPVLPLKSGI